MTGITSPSTLPRTAAAPDQAQQLRDLVRRRQPGRIIRRQVAATPAQPQESPVPQESPPPAPVRRAKVIAVTSGKGGVGKTNVAVNLAARFAQAGKKVVLLDADMGLANADVLCGVDLRHNLAHVLARRKTLADVMTDAPGGFSLIGGASGLAKMADLPAAEHGRLVEALCELEAAADLILIDTGAGISPNVLGFTRTADQVLVVTTPEPTAITDAYAVVKVIARERQQGGSGTAPISLVVNEAVGPAEAKATYDRIAGVARQFLGFGLDDGGYLPLDPHVARAVRRRRPFLLEYPRSPAAASITRLARLLESGVAAPAGETFFGRLGRLFRRK